MDDLLTEFLTETAESLATLDVELVRLEQNPSDPEIISNVFRIVHTIKGTCGFLGLPRLERVAHAGENVLGKIRDREIEADSVAVSLILECFDRIRMLLAALEQTQAEPEGEDGDLIARLNAFADGTLAGAGSGGANENTAAVPADTMAGPDAAGDDPVAVAAQAWLRRAREDDMLRPFLAGAAWEDRFAAASAALLAASGGYDGARAAADFAEASAGGFGHLHYDNLIDHFRAAVSESGCGPDTVNAAAASLDGWRAAALGGAPTAGKPAPKETAPKETARTKGQKKDPAKEKEKASRPAKAAPATAAPKPDLAEGGAESAVASQSIRVRVDLLEDLMNMVSELVLTRNQLLQILRSQGGSEFEAPLQRLNHVTSELQEGIMKTRMQPIGNAWAKLPRIVRDLAHELGKKIDLQMVGAETELDRQVLELIKDPLTHMVRNSADHGLEMPAERLAAGKVETGRVVLKAYQEGGHIIIQIADDGAGINIERVKEKALQNGLASEAEIEGLSDQQILNFIFKPGFSTAAQVTSVSGRGVGMDVVRTNVEKIGGTIELKSVRGKGSVFTIKIPLTLAIVSALIVEAGGERFAIPQLSVLELVLASPRSEHTIETVNRTRVLRLRNRLLPLVSLGELLGVATGTAKASDDTFVVVSQVGTYTFGIMVDRVFDTEEIVVKPVAPILREISIFSGNTILGDGSVIMILDPNGIAAATGDPTMRTEDDAADTAEITSGVEKTPLLVFRAGSKTPKAVPLGLVARLEEVKAENVERSGGKAVVQYRGHLMPLVGITPDYDPASRESSPVLVFTEGERTMGLIVDEIIDIVEVPLDLEMAASSQGIMGSAIIEGQATEVLDASHYLTAAYQDWFKADKRVSKTAKKSGRNLLLVDDSAFFRNLLAPLLSTAGYKVTSVGSAEEALDLREKGRKFDLIVSDVDMPGMDGFAFVEAIRAGEGWAATPVVALSSHTAPEDFDRGREAGFDDYVAKSDRDGLISALEMTLAHAGAHAGARV